jgi:predicted HicB family RNase H-like nuclease
MARSDEVWVQLATRIPKALRRDLRLHCVHHDISVMDFVTQAIEEKLKQPPFGPGYVG